MAVNPNLHCGRCEYCQKGQHSLCVSYGILGEHTHGGLAELVKVDGRKVLKLPDHVKYEDAAAFVLVNMTAWRMLVSQARLRAGEDLLIIGVGGGVSSTGVQIGKLCGARVWVTSSSDEKLERARALGADECINYSKDDWVKAHRSEDGAARRGRGPRERGRGHLARRHPRARQGRPSRDLRRDVGPHLRDRRASGLLEAGLHHRLDHGDRTGSSPR